MLIDACNTISVMAHVLGAETKPFAIQLLPALCAVLKSGKKVWTIDLGCFVNLDLMVLIFLIQAMVEPAEVALAAVSSALPLNEIAVQLLKITFCDRCVLAARVCCYRARL